MFTLLAALHENLPHVVCALLLIARVGDVGTTYLVTPSLALEANPIVRKLGWRYGLATIAVCLLPYFSVPAALAVLMASLLVSASNAGKIWFTRAVGEEAFQALLIDAARKSKRSLALATVGAAAFFIALAGATILLFYPFPDYWGFWIGLGVLLYAMVVWIYGSLSMVRLFRRAQPAAGAVVATGALAAPPEPTGA